MLKFLVYDVESWAIYFRHSAYFSDIISDMYAFYSLCTGDTITKTGVLILLCLLHLQQIGNLCHLILFYDLQSQHVFLFLFFWWDELYRTLPMPRLLRNGNIIKTNVRHCQYIICGCKDFLTITVLRSLSVFGRISCFHALDSTIDFRSKLTCLSFLIKAISTTFSPGERICSIK